MRSKEEIAAIANEITRRVHAQRILDEYYRNMVPEMIFFDAWTNTCFHSRIRDVIRAQEGMKEAFARYRERVKETLAEEQGLPIEEFYKLLEADTCRWETKSVTGI